MVKISDMGDTEEASVFILALTQLQQQGESKPLATAGTSESTCITILIKAALSLTLPHSTITPTPGSLLRYSIMPSTTRLTNIFTILFFGLPALMANDLHLHLHLHFGQFQMLSPLGLVFDAAACLLIWSTLYLALAVVFAVCSLSAFVSTEHASFLMLGWIRVRAPAPAPGPGRRHAGPILEEIGVAGEGEPVEAQHQAEEKGLTDAGNVLRGPKAGGLDLVDSGVGGRSVEEPKENEANNDEPRDDAPDAASLDNVAKSNEVDGPHVTTLDGVVGLNTPGSTPAGTNARGPNNAGSNNAESNNAGPNNTGPNNAESNNVGPTIAGTAAIRIATPGTTTPAPNTNPPAPNPPAPNPPTANPAGPNLPDLVNMPGPTTAFKGPHPPPNKPSAAPSRPQAPNNNAAAPQQGQQQQQNRHRRAPMTPKQYAELVLLGKIPIQCVLNPTRRIPKPKQRQRRGLRLALDLNRERM
jgi:hypothetical protein